MMWMPTITLWSDSSQAKPRLHRKVIASHGLAPLVGLNYRQMSNVRDRSATRAGNAPNRQPQLGHRQELREDL
jgi:hypothetical protein